MRPVSTKGAGHRAALPVALLIFLALVQLADVRSARADSLPSWNDGSAKTAIVDFVARVTKEGAPDFVPAAERIATFDNDGTLWSEQPLYFQFIFMIDRGEGAGA